MEAGRYAVTVNARALMESNLDLVIEATGNGRSMGLSSQKPAMLSRKKST